MSKSCVADGHGDNIRCMADTNFFPNNEQENEDSKVQKKILDINAIIKKRLEKEIMEDISEVMK